MPAPHHTIYLIAGCNGAGKTTFAMEFLPREMKCFRFLNPDEIARGLSPLAPSAAAFKAGRLLLKEIRDSIHKRESFGMESTLSGKTYLAHFHRARRNGYRIHLHYLWLPTVELALRRIRQRVFKGGHDVPERDVRRRFHRSLRHLVTDYAPLVDRWAVWDNQTAPPKLMLDSTAATLDDLRQRLLP